MNKTLAACTVALLALGGALVPAVSASAHIENVTLECDRAFVSLTAYGSTATATVTLDGAVLHDGTFEGGYSLDQALDPNVNHTLTVVADSADGTDATQYDVNKSLTTTDCKPEVVGPVEHYEVGLYIYKKLDVNAAAAWENSGTQYYCNSKTGVDWFTTVPCTLPPEVCGPGWAYQQDKGHWTEPDTFAWPATVTYDPTAPGGGDNIGWPPIYAATHGEVAALGALVPPCDEEVTTVAPPTFEDACGPADDGSYSLVVPTDTASIHYEVTTDTTANWVKVTAHAKTGFVIKSGVQTEWKFYYTDEECPRVLDAAATAATTPGTCDAAGGVTFGIANADWENTTDLTDGSRLAIAKAGHAFPGGLTELEVTYVLQPKLTGALCTDLPTFSLTELPTLPMTGSDSAPTLAGGGIALLMLGLTASVGAALWRRQAS